MRKKITAFVMGVSIAAMALTGCGSGDSSSNASSSENSAHGAGFLEDDAVYGKVTVIDGENITIDLVTMNKPEAMPEGSGAPSGQDGEQPPAMPEGSGAPSGQDGEQPPAMPEGSGAPSGQDGQQPAMPEGSGAPDQAGMPRGNMGMTSTGESKTITISADVTVQAAGKEGTLESASLADITEGSIVQLTYDDDKLTTVTIQNMEQPSNGTSD